MDILFNKDVISISYKNNEAKIVVNDKTDKNMVIKTGQANSKDLTDASVLQFNHILTSGSIASVDNLVGESFELNIPWEFLKSKSSDETSKTLITIESKGSKLQVPLSGNPQSEENWLNVIYKKSHQKMKRLFVLS